VSQPNNFGFGEEAALLKDSARRFFAERLPVDRLHALVAAEHDPEATGGAAWREDLWPELVELGWTALAVPESAGGLGMPLTAVAGLIEEQGRAAFPGPLLPTLAATYVLAACGSTGLGALEEIAAGRSATLALTNRHGSWAPGSTEVAVSDGRLNGTAWFVQEARKAERLLVAAHGDSGLGLYWVASDAPGVALQSDAIVDLTRDQARVVFSGVDATAVADNGLAALGAAMPALWTLLAADMVGAGEWQLQTTVEYAQSRKQFDHPLGFFQAVKHQLVDAMVLIDESKSLVYNAACAFDCEPEKALQYAHMAKASAADMAAYVSGRSVQCHGGIGFTWESYVHLYFKRQKHSQVLFGDGVWHRARLADILLGEAA
jgi:alkylation response protein AidB-like acyl-CoA dehydrogenase